MDEIDVIKNPPLIVAKLALEHFDEGDWNSVDLEVLKNFARNQIRDMAKASPAQEPEGA